MVKKTCFNRQNFMNSFTFQYSCMNAPTFFESRWHLQSFSVLADNNPAVVTFYSVWSSYEGKQLLSVPHHTSLTLNESLLFWLSRLSPVNIVTTEPLFLQQNWSPWQIAGLVGFKEVVMMRECLFKSGNLTNLTSTITKCQMLVWPELIFSDPPVSHLGDVFFATFSPSKNPPHLTSGRLFFATFLLSRVAHLTSVWLRLRLLAPLVRQFCGEAWKGETASNGSTTKIRQSCA